jgi:hypothetical protein
VCKNGWENCEQFSKPAIGSTHTLRLELSTTDEDQTRVKAYLNGTLVVDVVDKKSTSAETKQCGDFGLATYDSDVVSYKIKDYTGAPPKTIPVDVEFEVAGETEASFTEDKQTAFINAIAEALGIDASLITLTLGLKANPIARRLVDAPALLITITIAMEPNKMVEEVEKLESPALVTAIAESAQISVTFQAFKPAKMSGGGASPLCARCKWENNRIVVEHFINAQKHGEKGLQHKCYHLGDICKCKCMADAFPEDSYREGNALLGRYITPGPKYGTPGLNWDGVTDVDAGN